MAASTCETTKNYNIEHFALPLWFHNWRRFFKYNDKTHFKIGIQPRHRRLHRRFAAIRRSLHSQKKCAAPTADGGTSGTCKTKRTGVFGRTNTDIAISSGHLGQRPLLLGGGGIVPFAKRDDCNTEANDSAISFVRMSEIYLRQKKVSQLTRVTEENDDAGVAGRVRNRAGNQRVSPLSRTPAYGDTLNSAPRPSCRRPPRNPPYGEIPAPAAIPARPAPEQYPAISCAEKLRPDETKIPKTTTNRMKIYSFRILQIEIFYLFLSKCFPLMEKRPDHYRPKPNRMGTSTIVYTIFARRMRHASTRRSEGIIPPPIGI